MRNTHHTPNKLIFAALTLLAVFSFGSVAHAATFHANETYVLEGDELVDDDFYVAADTIDLFGRLNGDAFAAGNTVRVAGSVRDDAMIVAGNAVLIGDYGDDVRIAAGTMAVASTTVAGDMLIAAGVVELEHDVRIDGDLVIAADRAVVDGTVAGTLRIYARQVELTGTTSGDVIIRVSESVALKDDVSIGGSFNYTAPREALMTDTAMIAGETTFTRVERSGPSSETMRLLFELFSALLWAVSALILVFLFPRRITSVVDTVLGRQGLSVLVGLAAFGMVPLAMVLLLFTGIGIPLGLLGLLLYIVGLFVSHLLTPVLAGVLVLALFNKKNNVSVPTTLVGVLTLFLVNLLPILGFIFTVVLLLAVFGALLELLWRALRATEDVPPALREENDPPPAEPTPTEDTHESSTESEPAPAHDEQPQSEETDERTDK